jgi:hypothetical protein
VRRGPKRKDLRKQKFHFLVAVKPARTQGGRAGWLCHCKACGNKAHVVRTDHLLSGDAKSCGCRWLPARKKRATQESKGPQYERLLKKLKTVRAVAEKCGVHVNAVYKSLRKYRNEQAPRNRPAVRHVDRGRRAGKT